MRRRSLPFDHRPDPVLCAALHQALSAEDHATFVVRVAAALAMPRTVHWDVLAAWARRGIAAACVATLGTGLLVGVMELSTPVDLIASVAAPSARELVVTVGPPDPAFFLVPAGPR